MKKFSPQFFSTFTRISLCFILITIIISSITYAQDLPVRGNKDAKLTLIEFSDFQCPFCYRVLPTLKKLIEEYPNELNWVYRHYPLRVTPKQGSYLIHEAAVCAGKQNKFWEFHDEMYSISGNQQIRQFEKIVKKIGMDTSAFETCMNEDSTQEAIFKDLKEAQRRGVRGTPAIFIGPYLVSGAYPYEYFKQLIEFILDPDNTIPPDPLVEWGGEERIVEFKDLDGRPSRGPKDAVVTLVEFSDFHCPFCKRLAPIFSELMDVHKGKIRQIWRHFPLGMHPGADLVHQATECAHAENKFWEFHQRLLTSPNMVSGLDQLINIGEELGMNAGELKSCIESSKFSEKVEKDKIAGRKAGVQGTPTLFINGKKVVGAYPFEHYDLLIQDELNS